MELLSLQFVLLLAAALTIYYVLGRFAPRFQWVFLLATSLYFYFLMADLPALGLILATATDVWAAGLALDHIEESGKAARKGTRDRAERKAIKARTTRRKRIALALALIVPVALLGYFKYANVVLFNLNLAESPYSLKILLPLGISFYTFQSLGYLIDSYNAKYPPERSLPRFILFVTWFPQLIQGPIGRYDHLAAQLTTPRRVDLHGMRRGLIRFGYGTFKKLAIANVLAANIDIIFHHISPTMPGSIILYGVLAYSIQMYADFSGGIDMVEGISELFGVEMDPNFQQPYLSTSLADFWRRWHMSLGVWMRGYVFYPLALTRPSQQLGKWAKAHLGNQIGRTLPACVANIIVFVLVGLWHGAELHYLAWGLYNGVIIALSDLLAPAFAQLAERTGVNRETLAFRIFAIVRTFVVVNIGRFFDRTYSVADSITCIKNVLFNFNAQQYQDAFATYGLTWGEVLGIPLVVILSCVAICIVSLQAERGADVRERFCQLPAPARLAICLTLAGLAFYSLDATIMGGGGFLYANF